MITETTEATVTWRTKIVEECFLYLSLLKIDTKDHLEKQTKRLQFKMLTPDENVFKTVLTSIDTELARCMLYLAVASVFYGVHTFSLEYVFVEDDDKNDAYISSLKVWENEGIHIASNEQLSEINQHLKQITRLQLYRKQIYFVDIGDILR